MRGVTTTGANPTPTTTARAREVARLLEVPFVRRNRSLSRDLDQANATHAYVVGRDDESVQTAQTTLRVDLGMLHAKVNDGPDHPLIRALGGAQTVVDGTLGLAGDALHIAAVLRARVHGIEVSPWVHTLVGAGLSRLRRGSWADAVERIEVHRGADLEVLASLPPVDAIFIAPMFDEPALAAPGFDVFRELADARPICEQTWSLARARAGRVVVRVERAAPAPFPGMALTRGKAVDYWVWTASGSVGGALS